MAIKKINSSKIILVLIATFIAAALVSFTLVKQRNRSTSFSVGKRVETTVSKQTKGMNVNSIIEYSLNYTAQNLRFSRYNDLNHGKANCVGYAKMCASVCNIGLRTNHIDGEAKPVVGYIKSVGINWCEAAQTICSKQSYKNFVKDHDFVELTTKDKVYQFDPCLYDVFGISCLSEHAKK